MSMVAQSSINGRYTPADAVVVGAGERLHQCLYSIESSIIRQADTYSITRGCVRLDVIVTAQALWAWLLEGLWHSQGRK